VPDESSDKPVTAADVPAAPDAPTESEEEAAARPEDAMSPEAIAKRVAALGGDDELERLAREEELKEERARSGGVQASAEDRREGSAEANSHRSGC
jgi:hypothetical protein